MERFSEQQLADFREAFSLFDRDGDGCINAKELGTVLRSLGQSPTVAEVDAMLRKADVAGAGVIDFGAFVQIMAHRAQQDTEEQVRQAFLTFDRDDKGGISAADIFNAMQHLGESLTMEQAEVIVEELDTDGDGLISFREFVDMMLSD